MANNSPFGWTAAGARDPEPSIDDLIGSLGLHAQLADAGLAPNEQDELLRLFRDTAEYHQAKGHAPDAALQLAVDDFNSLGSAEIRDGLLRADDGVVGANSGANAEEHPLGNQRVNAVENTTNTAYRQCMLPDGRIVPYEEVGDGYLAIPDDGKGDRGDIPDAVDDGGFALGRELTQSGMPTVPKRGGLGGGGKSGPWTSPASAAFRGMTGRARLPFRVGIGKPSFGGTIGKALPFVGPLASFLNYLDIAKRREDTPICKPLA